jgi:hypothetical protein
LQSGIGPFSNCRLHGVRGPSGLESGHLAIIY